MTSHELARYLLEEPDGFITATHGNREYVIESYKRVPTHANIDDKCMYWTLNLQDGYSNNMKKGSDLPGDDV